MGLRAFEELKPVAAPHVPRSAQQVLGRTTITPGVGSPDDVVVVVPANEEGFKAAFLGEHRWYPTRISFGRREQIRYIAAYQTKPVMAVTH